MTNPLVGGIDYSLFHKDGRKTMDIDPSNWENWLKPDLEDFQYDQNGIEMMVEKDPRLRPPGVELPLTPEHVYEYMRCSVSPHYFMTNYCVVLTFEGYELPEPREYQLKLLTHIHTERHSASMMPRQSGKTVTVGAYISWYVTFHSDKTALVLAHQKDIALEHLQTRIQPILYNLPKWMQQGAVSFIKTRVELENGSRIIVQATSGRSGAGMAINLLYLDEFALVEPHKASDFISAVMPTISSMPDSKVIITSTPRGMNHFHKMYKEKNAYIPFGHDQKEKHKHISWREVPRKVLDEATGKISIIPPDEFKKQEIENIGEVKWNQEYECKFAGSSNTLLDGDTLENLATIDPITTKFNGKLKIYEEPRPGNVYVTGVDVSYGLNRDNSAFVTINVSAFPFTLAATYKDNKISDRSFPAILREMGMYYNQAITVIENNGPGARVADDLWEEFEYDNIFTWHPQEGSRAKQRGIKMTPHVKTRACNAFKELVENQKLIICCSDLIEELYVFVSKGNSWAADDGEGNYDDLVMAAVVAAFFINLPQFQDYVKSPMNYSVDVLGNDLTSIGNEMGSLFKHHNGIPEKPLHDCFSVSQDSSWLTGW